MNNNFLTVISLLFILVSSFSTNLIANYIPAQNTLINFLPNFLTIKKTGFVIILLALLVATFWLSIFSNVRMLTVLS